MTLKREIKDAYLEGGNSIYVKTHSNAVYVNENETETLTQRLDNIKVKIDNNTVLKVGGEFKTINEALAKYDDNKVIYLMPNRYIDRVSNRRTNKKIIGFDKDLCIIYDNSSNYDTPPIEIAGGILKNITAIEKNNSSSTHFAYALHADDNALENNELIVENCKFKANLSHCVGIGTRAAATLLFENCVFETTDSTDVFYLHNTQSQNTAICNVIFKNCTFRGEQKVLKLQNWRGANNIDFTFINNTFYSKTLESEESVYIEYRSYEVDLETLKTFKKGFTLNKASHGNNVSFLNA